MIAADCVEALCYTGPTHEPLPVTSVAIPNRSVFRAQEVCDLAELQPYVLRTWEAEFPDLGVAKSSSGPRVYRRADVERVLHIKQLLFVEGLTLAGARRRLSEEGFAAPEASVTDADVAALIDDATRQQLVEVRRGLQWILGVLTGDGVPEFILRADARGGRAAAEGAGQRTPRGRREGPEGRQGREAAGSPCEGGPKGREEVEEARSPMSISPGCSALARSTRGRAARSHMSGCSAAW